MKILLTGANGYIGMRLLPVLVEAGHDVTCVVRESRRFQLSPNLLSKINVIDFDFLHCSNYENVFGGKTFDVAYYLIHSLKDTFKTLEQLEKTSAENFIKVAKFTNVKQVIYLGGISNSNALSNHLSARKIVKNTIENSGINYTIFEAGVIVGSGSASFEIIRDLVEKLPVMITPLWIKTKCQPIAIRNVINYLSRSIMNEKTFNRTFEIGGPDILSYKEMMLQFAEVRGYKRRIYAVPFITPKISSYWLYFATSTNFTIARQLAESLKNDVVCQDNSIREIIPQEMISYKEAIKLAFEMIMQNMVVSSWKDASTSTLNHLNINDYIEVPTHGCFKDRKWLEIPEEKIEEVSDRFFGIGGEHGWYYADILWRIRGGIDKILGGVGSLRGRRNKEELKPGDALDLWRVILADRKNYRLLLFAEMKMPGEAWLEFVIVKLNGRYILKQTATFRPRGIKGRNYWYSMVPFHYFIFNNMIRKIAGVK
ncbi:MAG: SDR family oxidoreductase [Bacteroidetes bacterium]|nr:SDR family oxidoreductase [Bacteroidota bacterium]